MSTDGKDAKEARKIAIGLAFVGILMVIAVILVFGEMSSLFAMGSEGLGWRTGAVISFFLTTGLLVLFALAGGDGLFGEIQYMIGAFFGFFAFFWLMLVFIF